MGQGYAAVRSRVVVVHRWLGLVAALPVLVSAVTGAFLVFEPELDRWSNRDVALVTPRGERLPYQMLAEAARAARPDDSLLRIMLPMQPEHAAVFETRGRYRVYVDPYDGHVLATRDMREQLMPTILQLHTELLAGELGNTVVGCSALVVMGMCLTGLFIWWPRGLQGLVVAWRRSRGRVLYDLHAAAGAWTVSVLLLIGATGAAVTFQKQARALLGPSEMYPVPAITPPSDDAQPLPLDAILTSIADITQDADEIRITFPRKPTQPLRVTLYRTWSPYEGLLMDPFRGEVIAGSTRLRGTLGDAIYMQDFPIHTGSFGGLATRVLWLVAILGIGGLPITGALMWGRKRFRS